MGEKLKKTWNDPVWSKVIATGIWAAIVGSVALVVRIVWGSGSKFLGFAVPLWLVVFICAGAFIVSVLILSTFLRATYGFSPQLKLINVSVSDPDPNQTLSFPIKCYFTFRNDSQGCIEVSVSDFESEAVILKGLGIAVFQVQLNQKWLPADHGVDRVSVLPGQLFRGWVAPDESKFDSQHVRGLLGKLGTLRLLVNGKALSFKL